LLYNINVQRRKDYDDHEQEKHQEQKN